MLVFCLHHVSDDTRGGPAYRQFLLTPDGLRRAIRTVRRLGLEFVSLADVVKDPAAFWQTGHARKAILTFDDGYENFLTHALPVLEQEACPATVFVVAGQLGGTNDWNPEVPVTRLVSLDQLRHLTRSGLVTVGSHSLPHRRLPALSPDDLSRELATSHQLLSTQLGAAYLPVLAYPYGDCSPAVLAGLAHSPYRFAFTIRRGHWLPATPAHEIPRFCLGFADTYPLIFFLKCLKNHFLLRPR